MGKGLSSPPHLGNGVLPLHLHSEPVRAGETLGHTERLAGSRKMQSFVVSPEAAKAQVSAPKTHQGLTPRAEGGHCPGQWFLGKVSGRRESRGCARAGVASTVGLAELSSPTLPDGIFNPSCDQQHLHPGQKRGK